MDAEIAARFWANVDRRGPDECWPWLLSCNRGGYGQARLLSKKERAHRIAFFLTHGRWPVVARHSCDNPPCCNPAHLLDGTQADNMVDMLERGRRERARRRGASNGRAKLVDQDVDCIRKLYLTGLYSLAELGRAFGVSKPNVWHIVHGKVWRPC